MRLNTDSKTSSPRRRTTHGSKTTTESNQCSPKKADDFDTVRRPHEREKRVSFEDAVLERTEAAERQQEEEVVEVKKQQRRQQQQEEELEEQQAVELCDIEPISGTVFRKVTVRRRRQEMRKIPAVDTGELVVCFFVDIADVAVSDINKLLSRLTFCYFIVSFTVFVIKLWSFVVVTVLVYVFSNYCNNFKFEFRNKLINVVGNVENGR